MYGENAQIDKFLYILLLPSCLIILRNGNNMRGVRGLLEIKKKKS